MTFQVFMHVESRELEIVKPEFYEKWEQGLNWIEG
jgi:hypothetical protein